MCTCVHVRVQTDKGRARIFLFSSLAGVLRSGCSGTHISGKRAPVLSGFVCILTLLPWLKSAREEDSKHFLSSGLPTWAWALCCLAAPVSYACHPPRPSTEPCPAPLLTLWQPFPRRSQEPLLQIVWSAAWGQLRRLAHPGPLCIL